VASVASVPTAAAVTSPLASTVGAAMTREVIAVAVDTGLETAARLCAQHHISAVPVVDESGRPLGVISQSDLVDPDRVHSQRRGRARFYRVSPDRVAAEVAERPPGVGIVADVMTPFVLAVGPETALAEATRLMLADDVHRVLVVSGQRLVGVLSTMDVLRRVAR
jgi:CBS domain-containing protein